MREQLEALAARLDAAAKEERRVAESYQKPSYGEYQALGRAEAYEQATTWAREILEEGKP